MNRLAYLLFFSTLFAEEALDLNMTAQERKQTGVYKLTSKEKAALQRWIDAHYDQRSTPFATAEIPKEHAVLTENLYNGRYIRLSDQTLWEIRPSDINLTLGWITSVEIIVTRSNNPDYPYKLTNSLTGSSVYAKPAKTAEESLP